MSIRNSYNKWAKTYDNNINRTRDLDKNVTQRCLSNLKFEDVIELGCGTGKNTSWLANHSTHVTAIDFSAEMLAQAKQIEGSDKVSFIQADISEKWPINIQAADLVTCNLVLEHIEDLSKVFSQAHNNLKSNGHLFVCELHPFKQYQGSGARYDEDGQTIKLKVFQHHISEYLQCAKSCGFYLINLEEWFDEEIAFNMPRLLSLLFKKV